MSIAQSEIKLQQQLVEVRSLIDVCLCVFESDEEMFIFVLCSRLCVLLIQQTHKQQGGEVMDDSVKKWWPKVVTAAGADTEQAILDLEGVRCAVFVVSTFCV